MDWFFWLTPKTSHIADREKKKTDNPCNTPSAKSSFFPALQKWYCFFCPFSLHQADKFPLKNRELYRLRVDGACPFCSGLQVWADNCQVCAAETDDYRLYCLSQAQSTLIQQSHLSLIYESCSLFPHSSIPYLLLICLLLELSLMSLLPECPPAVTIFPSRNAAKCDHSKFFETFEADQSEEGKSRLLISAWRLSILLAEITTVSGCLHQL